MKKAITLCTAALLLALLFSCSDDGSGAGSSSNPFIGNWSGTASLYGLSAPATVTVTGSGWTFRCPDALMNESGTMTVSGNSATLRQGSVTFGTAAVSEGTLTVTVTSGPYQGGTGTFTKQP